MTELSPSIPKVSVLLAVYNGRAYLRESIESVLNQTYRDFEFIIINDGSTDDSREIVLSYSDERIRLINNPENLGLTASLNHGLNNCRGEWVVRVDADDSNLPERITAQLEFIEDNKLDICFSDILCLGDDGEQIRNYSDLPWEQRRWRSLFSNAYGPHPSVCFRRSAILKLGGYDENFPVSQDYDLWDRCVEAGLKIGYVPQVLVRYRLNQAGITSTQRPLQLEVEQAISLRAIKRVCPELTEKEILAARWILRMGIVNGPQAIDLKAARKLINRYHSQLGPGQKPSNVWCEVRAAVRKRILLANSLMDKFNLLRLWLESKLKSRGFF